VSGDLTSAARWDLVLASGVVAGLPDDLAEITELIVGPTMLGRAATLEDVANVVVFAASDRAASMTGTSFNITCGAVVD
jgi:3-oxoacyl-[acyl-carrier protein] reductase